MEQKTTTSEKKRLKYVFCRYNVFSWGIAILKSLKNDDILTRNGTHFISAYPGGGKSLLLSYLINKVEEEKPGQYFWLCNLPEYKQENVYSFNMDDIFQDGKQVKKFPLFRDGRRLYAVIFDEINLSFNRRMNGQKFYNDKFIGLIEFLTSRRHQGIEKVYFLGQRLDLQDVQLQLLFLYHHDILKIKKFPLYKKYNESGKLVFYPVKLKILNKIKNDKQEYDNISVRKLKISEKDFSSYDTHVLKQDYNKLQELYIVKK